MTREQQEISFKGAIERKEREIENYKRRIEYDLKIGKPLEAELDRCFLTWSQEELQTLNDNYLRFLLEA